MKVAARSVLTQQYRNIEWLIIDDGSTDDTVEVVKRLAHEDGRIRFFSRNREPKGANCCRNIGIENAKGEYILFLDSDDCLLPACVSERVAALNSSPQLDFIVFPGAVYRNGNEQQLLKWNVESTLPDLQRFLMFDGVWQTSGVLWRAGSVSNSNLLWDEQLVLWQDVDFHSSAILKGMKYKVLWTAPVDHLIKGDSADSLSRVNYHSTEKINSRKYFWEKYLHASARHTQLLQLWLRPLMFFVLNDAIVTKNSMRCRIILKDALQYGLLSKTDRSLLLIACLTSIASRMRFNYLFSRLKNKMFNHIPTLQKQPLDAAIDISCCSGI